MSDAMKECVIEWSKGDSIAAVTMPSNTRLNSKLRRLNETHDEMDLLLNEDGCVFCHVPVSWIKISPPRKMSEEQREKQSQRMKEMHNNGVFRKDEIT